MRRTYDASQSLQSLRKLQQERNHYCRRLMRTMKKGVCKCKLLFSWGFTTLHLRNNNNSISILIIYQYCDFRNNISSSINAYGLRSGLLISNGNPLLATACVKNNLIADVVIAIREFSYYTSLPGN